MYNQIKNDISREYYQKNFPNDGQRFIAWYLRNIHLLDEVEAKSCITDGPGDKQIDAVYIDDQAQTIYIIQGKFYGEPTVDAEPLREVLSSWAMIHDLPQMQNDANDKLKVKISEIATALEDDDYEISFELITTAGLTEAAEKDFEALQSRFSRDESLRAKLVLVDKDVLQARYDEALNHNRPYINHTFSLEQGKFVEMQIDKTKAVLAAIRLKDCVKIPGIKDGSLFRKNVRQSLGTGNRVNKAIARTLKNEPNEFFFLHNGITAICSSMSMAGNTLSVRDLSVVNGCQSLTTISSCSEFVRKAEEAYVLFRFYEIGDTARADSITTSTNSQSAVSARDLRSNDKYVIKLKKAYEQAYSDGYFITKRGEKADSTKYNTAHIVDLTSLGKQLIAWHSQRPTISYSETKIFDKYFDQLFHRDYSPENVQALSELFQAIREKWIPSNPLDLHEALLPAKSYGIYHHLYAISVLCSEINHMLDLVPNPAVVLQKLKENDLMEDVVAASGFCLNMGFQTAIEDAQANQKVFSPQNWSKAKGSLQNIRTSTKIYIGQLKLSRSGGTETFKRFQTGLKMSKEDFESRWSAD